MAVQFFVPNDLTGIAVGADPDFQLKQHQVAAADAFKNGVPTTDGTPNGPIDWNAAARTMFQKGAFEPAKGFLDVGIQQQQLRDASRMTGAMSQWLYPSTTGPASSPGTGTGGFDPSVNFTLKQEGGLNPKDTNGTPTNFGINQAANPGVDVAHLTTEGAKSIYRSKYWDAIGGDSLSPQLQTAVFDSAVMMGPERAKALLAQSGGDPMKFLDLREGFLGNLLAKDPDRYGKYANAWSTRNAALRQTIGGMPSAAPVPAATSAQPVAAPARVAQNGASDAPPPSSQHPYAPPAPMPRAPAATPPAMVSGPGAAPSPAPPAAPGVAMAPPATGPAIPPPLNRPAGTSQAPSAAPMPTSFTAPPPISPNAGTVTPADDPTFGGQVPLAWLKAGHSAGDWVRYQRVMAGIGSGNPFAKGAAEQWSKSADGLQQSIEKRGELTTEQKIARDPIALQAQQDLAIARGRARADAEADNALVPVVQADGATTLMPKRVAMAKAAQGDAVLHSLPGYVTSGQKNLQDKLDTGSAAYQERQIAGERLDALSNLLSTYQTGANSTAFNNAAAKLRSFGIAVPDSAMVNPAAMQEFAKNSYANVLSSMREQGNKQFVSEVQSAINSNPSTDLQPEANAAMVAQMRGIQQYHDQNFRDYADWYDKNRGASNDAKFQIDWAKKNPVEPYVAKARKEIAPMGVPLPPKNKLVDGQAYMVRGQKARWSASANGFVPVGAN